MIISADTPSSAAADESSGRVVVMTIPVAPPANLVNPDKPVPMATAPAHISTASALTKQKLLQTIQMKEQQKLLEQTIAQQLGQSPEMLAQALKTMIPVCIEFIITCIIIYSLSARSLTTLIVVLLQVMSPYSWHRQKYQLAGTVH